MTDELKARVSKAVKHFWRTRQAQQTNQGAKTGRRDYGARGAVTGGKQLDGFVGLINDLLVESGLPQPTILTRSRGAVILPGFFRPTKQWDLPVVVKGNVLAAIEFKSQVGPSFGNNYNNRTEEALGSAIDLWTAYRENALKGSVRPRLGYFMLLEETEGSTTPVAVDEPHFPVFPECVGASYAKRYQLLCLKLVRERLYDATCLLMSNRERGKKGYFAEPLPEISFANFAASLTAQASSHMRLHPQD